MNLIPHKRPDRKLESSVLSLAGEKEDIVPYVGRRVAKPWAEIVDEKEREAVRKAKELMERLRTSVKKEPV
jgi:hypothetical protein